MFTHCDCYRHSLVITSGHHCRLSSRTAVVYKGWEEFRSSSYNLYNFDFHYVGLNTDCFSEDISVKANLMSINCIIVISHFVSTSVSPVLERFY